ncbi:hypothetical protein LQZ18_09285 [Lachnospiraceae bacterium ZAX-1]
MKEKWKKEITKFVEYNWKYAAVGLVALLMIANIVKTFVFDRKEIVLSVVVLDNEATMDADTLAQDLRKYLDAESDKKEIEIAFLDPSTGPENQMAFVTRVAAKAIDVVIGEEEKFDHNANGFCADLEAILPKTLLKDAQNNLIEGAVSIFDEDGEAIGKEEPYYYGIGLNDSINFETVNLGMEHPVIGIVANTAKSEQAIGCMAYFLEQIKGK